MKCFECDKTVQIKKYRAFMYSRVGLPNICLLNQPVEVCATCDTETPILRNVGKLHQAIGLAVTLQPNLLSGADLRFLRRSAGYKTGELAGRLSVAEETYSKWENGKRPISHNADKLARLSYLTALEGQRHEEHSRHVAKVLEMEVASTDGLIIALNSEDLDRPAKYLPESHEFFEEPEAAIVRGIVLSWEKTSLDTITGVATVKVATPTPIPGEPFNVCNQFSPTA